MADVTAHALVNFMLSTPIVEGLQRVADLGCNGHNVGTKRSVLATVFEHHAESVFAHLR